MAPNAAKLIGMVILAIGIAENASTSEPWGLKADRLGMDLQDFKAAHRREAAPGQFAPMCSDTSPRGDGVRIEGPALGRVNCVLDFPFERRRRPSEKGYIPPPTIAEVPMLSHAYRFLDGKLWRIEAFVAASDFPKLRAATEAKYGSPARVETEQFQNRLGAVFSGAALFWEADGQVLELHQMSVNADTSALFIYRRDLELEVASRLSKAAEKAATDM